MKIRMLFLTATLALTGVACTGDANDPVDEDALASNDIDADDGFTLTGLVLDVEAGAMPADMEGMDDMREEMGGLAVLPQGDDEVDNLDDCDTDRDAYIVYYDDETTFADDARDEDDFPGSLKGQRLTIEGTFEGDGDCTLTAQDIEVAEPVSDEGTSGAGTGADDEPDTDASPGPSASPESGDLDFFKGQGSPGSIGGTASPDPCEGQDACRETDGP